MSGRAEKNPSPCGTLARLHVAEHPPPPRGRVVTQVGDQHARGEVGQPAVFGRPEIAAFAAGDDGQAGRVGAQAAGSTAAARRRRSFERSSPGCWIGAGGDACFDVGFAAAGGWAGGLAADVLEEGIGWTWVLVRGVLKHVLVGNHGTPCGTRRRRATRYSVRPRCVAPGGPRGYSHFSAGGFGLVSVGM